MICPWEIDSPPAIEVISDEDVVLRQIPYVAFKDNKRFPNESHFIPDPDGLSVNWEKHCSVHQAFVLIGISHSPKNDGSFKTPGNFKAIKFDVVFLRKIEGIESVLHSPEFYSHPCKLGKPNNKSHSLIKFTEDVQIRMELSDWVGNNSDKTIVKPDFKLVMKDVEDLKIRLSEK